MPSASRVMRSRSPILAGDFSAMAIAKRFIRAKPRLAQLSRSECVDNMKKASPRQLTNQSQLNKVKHMTTPRKVLRTVDDVIDKGFGSAKAASVWAHCTLAAVSQWRSSGIPPGHHFRMAHYLEARGWIVDGVALGWI